MSSILKSSNSNNTVSDLIFSLLQNRFEKNEDKGKSFQQSCLNCNLNKRCKSCLICANYFCRFCYANFIDNSQLEKNKNKQTPILTCYKCVQEELKKANKLEEYLKERKCYNFDIKTECVKTPTWDEFKERNDCYSCKRVINNKRNICGLCGDLFCRECSMTYDGDRFIFKCPFDDAKTAKICHSCRFDTFSGIKIITESNCSVSNNSIQVNSKELLFNIIGQKTPTLKIANLSNSCAHCNKKSKSFIFCSVCADGFCKMCVNFYRLPYIFVLFKDKKKNLNPVCYGCRDKVIIDSGNKEVLNSLKPNLQVDKERKIWKAPNWQRKNNSFNCKRCDKLLDSKKYRCNICTDVHCKNCVIKCEDPSDVFFNPYDIYNFNMCFECRYKKFDGYKMEMSDENKAEYEEKITKQLEKEKSSKIESSVQNLFDTKFNLPNEIIIDSFSCMRKKSILILGKMFILKNNICFYSTMFNNEQTLTIPIKSIINFQLIGLLKNEFRIIATENDNNATKEYNFVFVTLKAAKHLKFMESVMKKENIEVGFLKFGGSSRKLLASAAENTTSVENYIPKTFSKLDGINVKKILNFEFPIDSNKLFEYAFGNDAKYSLMDFYKEEEFEDIVASTWTKNNKLGCSRSISFVCKIKNIPRMLSNIAPSKTHAVRTEQLIKDNSSFSICSNIQMPEMVYGDSFEFYHLFEVKTREDKKCNLNVFYAINFIKPIAFVQNKIDKTSAKDNTESLKKYFENLREKLEIEKFGRVATRPSVESAEDKQDIDINISSLRQQIKLLKLLLVFCFIVILFFYNSLNRKIHSGDNSEL